MKVSVRTLQYYDKEGLLKPSGYSEGGRRLYNNRDIVQLHQILSMKYLGFSLNEIKNNILSIDTPQKAGELLIKQKEIIEKKIINLNELLATIEALIVEISNMKEVDFNKYAKIIELIREKDENYRVVKYLDNKILETIESKFNKESAKQLIERLQDICKRVDVLKSQNEKPESIKGQELAKEWWDNVQLFTNGNMSILSELLNLYKNNENWRDYLKERNIVADEFIKKALYIYLEKKEKGDV